MIDPIVDALAQLGATPRSFFQLMRRIDASKAASPSALEDSVDGRALTRRRRPSWLRLEQEARMDFAPSEISGFRVDDEWLRGGPPGARVAVRHFGLFAPYGPMPLYVTEHAQFDHRVAFEQFFRCLSADLAWLDFKAWSSLHPVVGCDVRQQGNAFVHRLSLLAGLVDPVSPKAPSPGGGAPEVDAHIRACRTHFVGMYAGRHRPAGRMLSEMLSRYFRVPIAVLPRTGGWQTVNSDSAARPIAGRWILGRRVFAPASVMTLLVGPVDGAELHRFQRGAPLARWIVGVAEDYSAGRVKVRLAVDVRTRTGMNGKVGAMRMGANTWATPVDKTMRLITHEPSLGSTTP